jgi:hypothetical protein
MATELPDDLSLLMRMLMAVHENTLIIIGLLTGEDDEREAEG